MEQKIVDISEKIEQLKSSGEDETENLSSEVDTDVETALESEPVPIDNPEAVIEAVLFSVGDSVEINKISTLIGRSVEETDSLLRHMKEQFDNDIKRGFTFAFLENSVQMCSKAELFEYIVKIAKTPKNYTLTDVVLETLSIIAYKQPVTRLEIEKIRGVSCEHTINRLLELDLIQELGRLDAPGRPLLFGTTEQFLRSFGVKSLDELPDVSPERLEEFKEEAAKEVQLELEI